MTIERFPASPDAGSDVREFEHLVAGAREDLAGGCPHEARRAVHRALDLWRGPAFADVPAGRSVAAEQVRLDELRTRRSWSASGWSPPHEWSGGRPSTTTRPGRSVGPGRPQLAVHTLVRSHLPVREQP